MGHKDGNQIRIKDIATKAGCSIGTVDRVIHNRGKVSEPVKKRILEIIRELDYKPNVNARVLASKRPLTLGILLPSFRKGEYWELPNLGIKEAIERYDEQGYKINAIHLTYNSPEMFYKAGMKLLANDIDGIIMNPATFKESVTLVRSFFQNNKPFILIDSDINGIPSLSFIGKDPVQSGLTVAKLSHQITKHIPGKKNIWIINLSKRKNQIYALLARESGFMKYFSDKQLQNDYSMITFDIEDHSSQKMLDEHIEKLLSQGIPNAIYVTGSRVYKIANSLKKLNLDQGPLLIGHDLIEENIAGVKDESIDFLIEEEAKRQGYLAVETMIRSIVYKEKIEKKQMMNLLIYTKENMPSYLLKQG
ncbi:MAG: LacI family DNA-binding transcriptional regulator [Bacteroidales bacterium]|nr:LacI family DNA-binding transcriptional regulator [Bacteroidales bacterium]